ncbi:Ig-like domain-containing protein [uncultured Methanobrevibacter sp.]|uniref:right-handed parallel beta-helix repeat-containing protein n=1 Tax=uncultured Methanobrevibacter sp. TaxID=253161 RepID=UPI0025EBC852|nr:Ig-like domain repeat protein [uncultured Methanobrevibacter sp.]
MNSNKILPLLGLLLLLILAIGSISAADADDLDDALANIDLTDEGQSVNAIDDSNMVNDVNPNSLQASDEDAISNIDDAVSDEVEEKSVGVKNTLKTSNLASTYKFKNSDYSTYFDSNGNIKSGKLASGDILDCSGTFSGLSFVINIPLTFKSTDGTAKFINCNLKIIQGAQGTKISNLNMTMDKLETPIIDVFNVSKITVENCNLFANASKSYPILFNTVNNSNIINNTIKTTCYVVGWGHPSGIVLSGSFYNNISNNNVTVNDSNAIYLTGYLNGGDMGQSGGVNGNNYIFNNTVHSLRGIEWALDENGKVPLPSSFCYGIQVMGANNEIINNTVYNVYRGIGATQSGNKVIGNNISNIHGTWYSGNTNDEGGDYAIYVTTNSLVQGNSISNSHVNASIYAAKNSVVTDNTIQNDGKGMEINANNVTVINNILDVTQYGIYTQGDYSNIVIDSNVINSSDVAAVRLQNQSRTKAPHDILIQNNIFYTNASQAIELDAECVNITEINNIVIGGGEGPSPEDENTTHYINEANFNKYFDLTGAFTNLIKENDTLIVVGSFSSKGKLNINNKVTITGQNAVFNDTTFLINENDVLFENITISNPNLNNMDRMWGIQINGVNNVTVQNCDISIYDSYSAFAIYILDASNCTILNNSLEARGNYFTVAVLSFNSHNVFLDGNSLKTIGTGETYLVNNKSCLDGYLNVYANTCVDGAFVCPDGYTICPDGSLLCPDGVTTISSEDYRLCAGGIIVCLDGRIIFPDGSTSSYDDSNICPDGSLCVDGITYCLDGTILMPNGDKIYAGGYVLCPDGSVVCPDGSTISSENCEVCPDGSIICADGTTLCPDGNVICTDGSTICADGNIICADGTTICPDGNVICADGTVVCPDGSVVCPDGSVYAPGEYTTNENGDIVCPDGTTICADGTIICADGTTICADGSGSSTILDGVVPGSHMVSGLYRTYGFLMVHSSNITFTHNTVNVSSNLGDYDLNESFNTIAGVFIHYGGFDNVISNNSIIVSSNDPVVYGIGIIGAPLNSTAIGSANNTFTYNNVTVNGSYLTACILLGNKVFGSDIEYNNFTIVSGKEIPDVVNYNASADNTIENNVFNKNLKTEFSFENVEVTIFEAYENAIFFKVVLKDKEGKTLAEKPICLIFNNTEYNLTTDGDGSAILELNIKEAGTYDIQMKFAGDDKYIPSSATGTVTVRKIGTVVTVSNVSYKTTDATKTLTATLKDENGVALSNKTITFTVNGKTYTALTNANGVASVKIALTSGGSYTISASFAGDKEYQAKAGTGKLTLTKQSTSLTSPNKSFTVTNTAKYIYVTIRDGAKKLLASKKITATVNGKTFSANTNAKGQAKIKLTLNAVKTFKVSLKFAGDATYAASSRTITVKVIKTKTKLAVPNRTYKRAVKVKKLTATLKDSAGKVVKSKKIVFTVNGKKYVAKTNSKGVATVKVKLSKKKLYKYTVRFAGDSKYLAVSRVGKVRIK